jgi:uncharacterized DUF497 family protein
MTPVFDDTYDRRKEAINVRKHGIDFVAARQMWDDADRIELTSTQRYVDATRWISIGHIGGKVWAAIYVYRPNGIRLISVHRATTKQERLYRG